MYAGVIIADDGGCVDGDTFAYCGPRIGSIADGGFAAYDDRDKWLTTINIPVILVSVKSADRLRAMMKAKLTEVISYGRQYVNQVNEDRDEIRIASMSVPKHSLNRIRSNPAYDPERISQVQSVFRSIGFENKKEKRKIYGTGAFENNKSRDKHRREL
jgi:hypothetical protein